MVTVFTNQAKSSSTFADIVKADVGFIVTDASDFVLVGSIESEYLVWEESTSWANSNKT